jgi:small nuclear ribonucleoprotein (snRNP)-like protein
LAKSVEQQQQQQQQQHPAARQESRDGLRSEEWYQPRDNQRGSGNLNVLSQNFDPVAMLTARSNDVHAANPWMSGNGMVLDNVDKFASFLPVDDPQRRETQNAKTKRGASSSSSAEANQNTKRAKSLHPFDAIAQLLDTGPISVLHRLQKKRVTVVVRYVNAIRGTLTGMLVAFDKHMNLILRDVEEVYTERPVDDDYEKSNLELELERRSNMCHGKDQGEAEVGTSVHAASSIAWDAGKAKRREMKQLMVRGDMVVSVYEAAEKRKSG